MSTQNSHVTREKVYEDVKVLIKDVQELLTATTSVVGDKATAARSRVQDHLKVVQDKLGGHYETVRTKGQEAFTVTDGYVRDNPWNAVGIAAGIGFILGISFSAAAFLRGGDDD
jgi:ElaB/YqjD/DUF883 family membrane-anchored ribosome-binding protein